MSAWTKIWQNIGWQNKPSRLTPLGKSNLDKLDVFNDAIDDRVVSLYNNKMDASLKGSANGVAELDENGLVPSTQLPSYVDDIVEGTAQNVTQEASGTFSAVGFIKEGESSLTTLESNKVYLDTTRRIQFRWTGTGNNLVSIGSGLTLGETQYTAYRGDRGKTAYDHATDASRLTTATASGLYKVASTAEGHIASLTAVQKSDLTALGVADNTQTFTEAETRVNIASGETLPTLFGKIKKFFSDLKTVAFTGSYDDLTDTPEVESLDDTTPYVYRQSPAIGTRLMENALVGGSVAWNQLVADSGSDLSVTVTSGHKYIMRKSGTWTLSTSDGTALTGLTGGIDMVFDITQMFDTSVANAMTVDTFRVLFPNSHYAYDSGSLQSVCVASKKVVGFNVWDEEWELGYYDITNGTPTASVNNIRGKNRIRIIPNTTYYLKAADYTFVDDIMRVCFYNADDVFIGSNASASITNGTIETPSNSYYMRFHLSSTYGTTYNHDICINISRTTGSPKNGDYLPYESHSVNYDHKTLRGIFKLQNNKIVADGDVQSWDGVLTRKYGIVDLGSLTWGYEISSGHGRFKGGTSAQMAKPSDGANCFTTKYIANTSPLGNNAIDKAICTFSVSGYYVLIRDDFYTDAATFKTAMSGVYLIYELATPTTETSTPFENPQISYVGGTEEFTDYEVSQDNRDFAVPVGHLSEYKALPEWTEDDYIEYLVGEAEAVGELKSLSKLGTYSTSTHTFSSLVLATGTIENVFTYISELVNKVYTAVNDLASALASKANNTDVKGTYDKYTYSTSTHKFDEIAVAEPNKTAVYMAGDINDKLVAAINDHADTLGINTNSLVFEMVENGTIINSFSPSGFNFLVFEYTAPNGSMGSTIVSSLPTNYVGISIPTGDTSNPLLWCKVYYSRTYNQLQVEANISSGESGLLQVTAF